MEQIATWGWPQWLVILWAVGRLTYYGLRHGQDMLQDSGENKGKPRQFNGFLALSQGVLAVLVLAAGGFFS